MATKAKELPSRSLLRLPAYKPPAADRVRHSDIWRRTMEKAARGENVTVEFPNGF